MNSTLSDEGSKVTRVTPADDLVVERTCGAEAISLTVPAPPLRGLTRLDPASMPVSSAAAATADLGGAAVCSSGSNTACVASKH